MKNPIIQLDTVDCINLLPCIMLVLEQPRRLDKDSRKGLEGLRDRLQAALMADSERRCAAGEPPLSDEEIERLGRQTVEKAVKMHNAELRAREGLN